MLRGCAPRDETVLLKGTLGWLLHEGPETSDTPLIFIHDTPMGGSHNSQGFEN